MEVAAAVEEVVKRVEASQGEVAKEAAPFGGADGAGGARAGKEDKSEAGVPCPTEPRPPKNAEAEAAGGATAIEEAATDAAIEMQPLQQAAVEELLLSRPASEDGAADPLLVGGTPVASVKEDEVDGAAPALAAVKEEEVRAPLEQAGQPNAAVEGEAKEAAKAEAGGAKAAQQAEAQEEASVTESIGLDDNNKENVDTTSSALAKGKGAGPDAHTPASRALQETLTAALVSLEGKRKRIQVKGKPSARPVNMVCGDVPDKTTPEGAWLQLLAQDFSGRLGAVRRSRKRFARAVTGATPETAAAAAEAPLAETGAGGAGPEGAQPAASEHLGTLKLVAKSSSLVCSKMVEALDEEAEGLESWLQQYDAIKHVVPM